MTGTARLSLRRWMFRLTAFRLGLVVSGLLSVGLFHMLGWFEEESESKPRFQGQVMVVGGDLDRHNAVRIEIRDQTKTHLAVDQRCRGGCDDLWVNGRTTRVTYRIDVFDAQGGVIAKRADYGDPSKYWVGRRMVRGADVLEIYDAPS